MATSEHVIQLPALHAIGSLLTGQLWETVAVPELREQAAVISGRSCARQPGSAAAARPDGTGSLAGSVSIC
jgi:hypothetical protein